MHPLVKVFTFSLFLITSTIQTGCGKVADTKEVETFCKNLPIGADHELIAMSLSSLGLELRARAPEAEPAISNLLADPYSVDGVLVTSKGLDYPNVVPACMIYFSSILNRGDGKIIHKQFITTQPKGI
ncbi:MAG: hypothetical protein CTY14_06165 [Methylotenera sp.]|nr:MAG: hypothetical protein CTY14_06165 [Methylotenera sp.]